MSQCFDILGFGFGWDSISYVTRAGWGSISYVTRAVCICHRSTWTIFV